MNTILLQKILDILTEGLAHVGDFFKDLFVSDPQDGQVIGYDANEGKWKNIDIADLSLELTHTAGPADTVTISDAGADMPVRSLTVDVEVQQAAGTPTPDNPLIISGTDSIVITHTYGNNETETKTINLPDTVYTGAVDVIKGAGTSGYNKVKLNTLVWTKDTTMFDFPVFISSISGRRQGDLYAVCEVAKCLTGERTQLATQDNAITKRYSSSTGESIVWRCDAYETSEALMEALGDYYIAYELATPTAISTTPAQINTHGGSETFAANAVNIEMEYYTDTAGTIKDLVCITDDITSEITKNTTDFSDILLKVSQNNKVVSIEIYSASTSAAFNGTFLSGLPKPAMNSKVLIANTTLGEDGIILGTLKTTGDLDITTSGAKTFSGLITYVAK